VVCAAAPPANTAEAGAIKSAKINVFIVRSIYKRERLSFGKVSQHESYDAQGRRWRAVHAQNKSPSLLQLIGPAENTD